MSKFKAAKEAGKLFEYYLDRLLRGFKKDQGRDPENLEMILIRQEAGNKAREADKVIEVQFGKPFGEEVDELIKKGEVNIGTAPKTPPYEKSQADIDFEIMEKIRSDNAKAVKAFEDRNPNKPRDEKYTGGIVDVEPNLSDIGHGSDALMSRTRVVSPGSQATTSTGLNYLLAEDNDNIRVPFSEAGIVDPFTAEDKAFKNAMKAFRYYQIHGGKKNFKNYMRMQSQAGKQGGGMENFRAEGGRIGFSKGKLVDAARRKFMKTVGGIGAGIGALKTGLLGFGEKAAPVVEKVTENFSSTASEAPQYFLDLVTKIKSFGKQSKVGPSEMMDEYYYTGKNGDQYTLTEDIATGDVQIVKDKIGVGSYGDKSYDTINDRTVLEFRAGRMDVKDEGLETQKGFKEGDEYEEYKVEFDSDGTEAGAEAIDEITQKEILEEASEKITKKAEGGRIGFSKGKLVFENAKKFLEKVFGKENMAEMPNRDPEMYQGMLEVVDMFRNRDKEGLKKYLQKFLPHMDDAQIEDFIVGDAEDMAGLGKFGLGNLQGQLIRLGSGRDYAGKIEAFKRLERNKELKDLEVTEDMQRKPNASGGLAKMLGE